MDHALVACIGAGLTLWSSGVDGDIPDACYTQGVDVVRGLALHGNPADVERLVSAVVQEIWQEWRNSRRKRQVLASHLEQLPALIAAYRPAPSTVTGIIAEAGRVRRGGGGGSVDLVAHRLASDIILGARTAGVLAERELDETFCFFLLSRLMSSMLARSDDLLAMRAAFDLTFGRKPSSVSRRAASDAAETSRTPEAAAASAPPQADASPAVCRSAGQRVVDKTVVATAEAYSVSVAALDAVVATLVVPGSALAPLPPELEDKASQLAELTARLAAAPPEALLAVVAEALEHGALGEIDDLLAEGEAAASQNVAALDEGARAELSFEAVQQDFSRPLAWRIMRSRFAELVSDWIGAARHLAFARTIVPPGARQLCGPILKKQAGALVSHGVHHDDEKALIEAAQVYAEAGGFLSEAQFPLEWAQANVDLGHLMLVLGERESRPERFLAAALHFKPAVDVFSRHQDLDRWAQAQIGLASSLKRTGEFQGDVVTLGDAAFAFRAALGKLTKDRSPQDWTDAQLGLGETLVRIAEETGEAAALEKAVPALKAALAQPRETAPMFDVNAAQAALGRAYVGLDAHHPDDVMLQEAISLLESAMASGSRALTASEIAIVETVRGTALRSLGERRSSLHLLEDAMRAKLNAVELHEQLGEISAVSRLREELEDLSAEIERLSSRPRRAAAPAGQAEVRTA